MSLKSGRVSHYLHDITFLCQDVSLRTPSAVSAAQRTTVCARVCVCARTQRYYGRPLICDLSDGLKLSAPSCGKKRTAKQLIICSSHLANAADDTWLPRETGRECDRSNPRMRVCALCVAAEVRAATL